MAEQCLTNVVKFLIIELNDSFISTGCWELPFWRVFVDVDQMLLRYVCRKSDVGNFFQCGIVKVRNGPQISDSELS